MSQLLDIELYKFMLVFLRIGAAVMLMPGFRTAYVNTNVRLCFALALCFVLLLPLAPELPSRPDSFAETIRIVISEITFGVFLGIFMQILFSALNLAGNIGGQAIGFANAQIFDPASQNQSVVIDSFLSITALTVVFITDLHHLMLSAVIDSYRLFPVGNVLPVGDFSDSLSSTLNQSFIMGFKIGSPFIAFTVIFYVGMGLVSRLMPQLNIFFLSLPLQIYLGLGLLFITVPIMIIWFTKYFEDGIRQFIN